MNNKGFAITGILYTLLILFLLILVSFLSAMAYRNNFLQKSIESFDDSFVGYEEDDDIVDNDVARYTGKYQFTISDMLCYSYLKKGSMIDINTIIFTTNDCNNISDKSNYSIDSVYVFGESD